MKTILILISLLFGSSTALANFGQDHFRILSTDILSGVNYSISSFPKGLEYRLSLKANGSQLADLGNAEFNCFQQINDHFQALIAIAKARGMAIKVPLKKVGDCQTFINRFELDHLNISEGRRHRDLVDQVALAREVDLLEDELTQCQDALKKIGTQADDDYQDDIINMIKTIYGIQWVKENIGLPR